MSSECTECGLPFTVRAEDLQFYERVAPKIGDKTFKLSSPSLCPYCREARRMSFRNEWHLCRRKCDHSGNDIISVFAPDSPYKVYDQRVWWTDQFDPLQYGREFDFSRPFFEQFHELDLTVPRPSIQNAKSENSEYTNYSCENKNCYMSVGALGSEDCYHTYRCFYCTDCLDCYDLYQCELCYGCLESSNLYGSAFSSQCQDGSGLIFCRDCIGCHDCIGCVNLRGKRNYIFNKPYSAEEFKKRKEELLGDLAALTREFVEFDRDQPRRGTHQIDCEGCVGDRLLHCKDCYYSFILKNSEGCSYSTIGEGALHCYDCNFVDNCELQYNSCCLEKNYQVICGCLAWYVTQSCYVTTCFNSNHLLGCVGLKKNDYCIFNRSYSVHEYETLGSRIISHMQETGEWGEFFPKELSPFKLEETLAAPPTASGVDFATQFSKELATSTSCTNCSGEFKVLKQEAAIVGKLGFQRSGYCPSCRRTARAGLLPPRVLFQKKCSGCNDDLLSVWEELDSSLTCAKCYEVSVV